MQHLKSLFLICASAASLQMSVMAAPNYNDPGLTPEPEKALSNGTSPRMEYNFNREWKFQMGDITGAQATSFDDSQWRGIHLPHSFSMPYFLSERFYVGFGWYRKTLNAPADWNGKRVMLDFDGAFQEIQVFVNGELAGTHLGGYTGFRFDITKLVKAGQKNVIALRVNNLWRPTLAPRGGEHTFSGGVYRDVHIRVMNPVHVDWYGTFVTTPVISKEAATISIKTDVVNDSEKDVTASLKTLIYAPNGKELTSVSTTMKIDAGKTITFDQTAPEIKNPELWTPKTPSLYTAVSELTINGKVADTYNTTFGCRWVKWDKDTGFYLNGERLYLRGANVHQDRAGWGDAATDAAFARDVQYMKDIGFEIIRGSHYPHDQGFVQACDKLGMFFWSENCFWGTGGFSGDGYWGGAPAYPVQASQRQEFEQSVRNSLRDMIRIHRNSPSILCWSMCNEVFFTRNQELGEVRRFLKELVAYTHELDPSRLAAVGGVQRGQIDKTGDIAGYNGDGARLREYLNPGIPNIVSEYGSTISERPGDFIPGFGGDGIQGKRVYEWRSGEILWCGIDHGSVGGRYGWMGTMDYHRLPKRLWYWYRENYAGVKHPEWPTAGEAYEVKLTADKNEIKYADGTDDVQLFATIVDKNGKALSNSPDVTIRIVSGPGELPTGSSITFQNKGSDIKIIEGKCSIDMRAYYAGETVVEATSPGLKSNRITIKSSNAPAYKGKEQNLKDLPYVRYTTDHSKVRDTTNDDQGIFRPTYVSSTSGDYSPAYAVDQNPATYWMPASTDKTPWFTVTPERFTPANRLEIDLTKAVPYYLLESSMDNKEWSKVSEYSGNAVKEIRFNSNTPATGLFFRISFKESTGISRFSVYVNSK